MRLDRANCGEAVRVEPQLLRGQELVILACVDDVGDLVNYPNLAERQRAQQYRYEADQRRSLLAHGLKRWCLSLLTGMAPQQLHFSATLYHKPVLPPFRHLHFNLSHSGRWVALVVSTRLDVGVDLEFPRLVDRQRIASTVLSAAQQQAYRRAGSCWQQFLAFWTQKEAVSKALGFGLHMDYQTIACSGELGHQTLHSDFGSTDLCSLQLDNGVLSVAGISKTQGLESHCYFVDATTVADNTLRPANVIAVNKARDDVLA